MKDRYIYPAIFSFDGGGISVEFPDLPGCLTCGDTQEEALRMAKDALALHLFGMEEDGDSIPEPSSIFELRPQGNQVVALIEVWMSPVREEMAHKAVNTTVTLPRWLKNAAKESGLNLSEVLQYAVKERLGIHERHETTRREI
ncbi:MAG: type II toxin-antitoxin system HicB family antitoxin [Alicyclobacillus shizuokensis]|nr:type II toxin-antitoxin system HicB family antitoxin [Alicyclobacillus shizuokensis]